MFELDLYGEPTPQELAFAQVEEIASLERLKCWIEAEQARAMTVFLNTAIARVDAEHAELENPPPAEEAWCTAFEQASAEIAMTLKIAGPTASARLSDAVELVSRPRLLDALSDGDITPTKVWILNEQTANLSREQADTVIDRVLSLAASTTPSQFRRAVRKIELSIGPDAVKRRAQAATKDRGVWLRELADGMAELNVIGPAGEVTGAYAVLDELARQSRHDTPAKKHEESWVEDRDGRTQPNRRFDAMIDLICGPLGHPAEGSTAAHSKRGPLWRRNLRVDGRVTIPFSTLFGIDDQSGHLAGYGPITADQARELAANGTWRRILTDPATGNPVDFGTQKYKPPARLRDAIITTHPTCQRPGCTMPAAACDLDHHEPWHRSGETTYDDTGPYCRRDHRLKQTPSWSIDHHPDGTATWTTPSGHTYKYKPEPIAEPVTRDHAVRIPWAGAGGTPRDASR